MKWQYLPLLAALGLLACSDDPAGSPDASAADAAAPGRDAAARDASARVDAGSAAADAQAEPDASTPEPDASVSADAEPLADAQAQPDASTLADAGTSTATFSVRGGLVGTPPVAASEVMVLWQVTSGSPDYLYVYGRASSGATSYVLSIGMDPPPAAVNSYGVAVGFVALAEQAAMLPSGRIGDAELAQVRGLSARHAVIWKGASAPSGVLSWSDGFAAGYSCGRCVDVPGTFDRFEPVECGNIPVEIPASGDIEDLDICNWT
jgi:hypothetical protein